MIVTVDGPAGAGKSTVCRLLAQELGFTYLDTGAMYRAVAWAWLHASTEKRDRGSGAVTALLMDSPPDEETLLGLPLHFGIQNGSMTIHHHQTKLEDQIRSPEITQLSSQFSQEACVRAFLTDWQHRLAEKGDVIAEGRDMGSVVFPQASIKVYLTASLRARTLRRLAEYEQKGEPIDYPTLEADIRARDERDSGRRLAPMRPAEDAVLVDTSDLSIPEVVSLLKGLVLKARE
ncbi:MAG: (d)CMP kinase [Syntrophobacteraceae bacterium]